MDMNGDERELCPFCGRKMFEELRVAHMNCCRKVRCMNEQLIECPYDAMHYVPKSELMFHKNVCQYRPMLLVDEKQLKIENDVQMTPPDGHEKQLEVVKDVELTPPDGHSY